MLYAGREEEEFMKAFDTLVAAKTKEIDALTASIGLLEPPLATRASPTPTLDCSSVHHCRMSMLTPLGSCIDLESSPSPAEASFASDDAPRAVFPSIVGRPKMPGIMVG